MKYLEAIKVIENKYAHLLDKTLINTKTGHQGKLDLITIKPIVDLSTYTWWDATDLNYAMFLTDKECMIVFLFDWRKSGMFGRGGIAIFEDSILGYEIIEDFNL